MIFFDYSPFANIDNEYFSELNNTTSHSEVKIENAVFDEIHIIENTTEPINSSKIEWQYDTVFLANFMNSLSAGNLGVTGGVPITQLKIKRKKSDDLIYEDLIIFDFDKEKLTYEYKDRFVESFEDYDYAIQPLGGSKENPIMGDSLVSQISVEFDSAWLIGKDKQYKLMYNLTIGDYETIIPSAIIETLSGQYPKISSNGDMKYRRGNLTCMIVSDSTSKNNDISPKDEKRLRRAIMDFMTDKKPKVFKDSSGEIMLVQIIDTPTLSPVNELGQRIYNISFSFVEIGGMDTESLKNAGILEMII